MKAHVSLSHIQGAPKKRKLLKSLIVKIRMPYEKAERNDA